MLRRQLLGSSLILPGALATGSLAVMPRLAQSEKREPELTGIDGWANTGPISLARLRGTVGLVNF